MEGKQPKVIAVYLHADWCGLCKPLSDKFGDLRNKFDEAEVLYVKLDHTTQSDRRQAAYMAHALGMEGAWAEHGGKTGFVLFVDGNTRRVIERSTHDQSLAQFGTSLQNAVRSRPGRRPRGLARACGATLPLSIRTRSISRRMRRSTVIRSRSRRTHRAEASGRARRSSSPSPLTSPRADLYGENPDVEVVVPTRVSIASGAFEPLAASGTDPQPQRKHDAFFDAELATYHGKVWYLFPVRTRRDAELGDGVLTIEVRSQACDESRCLPPRTDTIEVSVAVDAGAGRTGLRHEALFRALRARR
jgi:hypothetical protein